MKNIFFQEKSKDVLLNLEESGGANITEISRAINGTYAHTFNIIKDLEKCGIVSSKKEGRIKFVKLTKKGNELANLLRSFQEILYSKKVKTMTKKKKQSKTSIFNGKSEGKLNRYKLALEELDNKIQAKKITKAKAARMLGRYRALITKSRPRTKTARELKEQSSKIVSLAMKDLETLK